MVQLIDHGKNITFKIMGWHQLWALQSQFTIPKKNIIRAYQDSDEVQNYWKGFRFGTYVPFLITAGTYYWKGNKTFWDVSNKDHTIIVELTNSQYLKLFIDVENPKAVLQFLNSK